jgi:hypothetical protein
MRGAFNFIEQDPEKLMRLVEQINRLLDEKEARLLKSWTEKQRTA